MTTDETDEAIDETYWQLVKPLITDDLFDEQLIKTDAAIDDNLWKPFEQLMTIDEHWWHNWWRLMTTDDNWWHNLWQMMTTDDNLRGRIASTHLPDKKDMGATPQCLC